MKLSWSILLAVLALGLATGPLLESARGGQDDEERLLRRHPQTNILIDLPDDYSLATDWRGFYKEVNEASILLAESDERSLAQLSQSFFDPSRLRQTKRSVVSREERKFEVRGQELDGWFCELKGDNDGVITRMWATLIGDADGSIMVMAHFFPDKVGDELDVLKNAVETVVWDRPEKIDPFDHVDFTIDVKSLGALKYATKAEGMVQFTFGGRVDTTQNPGRPKLELTEVAKKVEGEEQEKLVRAQLALAPNLRDFKVDSIEEVEIDGIKGLKGWASGISETHQDMNGEDMPVTVLQVTLFDGERYFSLSGIIATPIGKNWLAMYQAGIASFRVKRPEAEVEPEAEPTPEEKKGETPAPEEGEKKQERKGGGR